MIDTNFLCLFCSCRNAAAAEEVDRKDAAAMELKDGEEEKKTEEESKVEDGKSPCFNTNHASQDEDTSLSRCVSSS